MTVDDFLARLGRVRQTGPDTWVALCPAHDDREPSLSVRAGDGGRIVLHCFAGCEPDAVTKAAGCTLADLFADDSPRMSNYAMAATSNARSRSWGALTPKPIAPPKSPEELAAEGRAAVAKVAALRGEAAAIYTYHGADGAPVRCKRRYQFDYLGADGAAVRGKTFVWYHPAPDGGERKGAGDGPRVLYRLPAVLAAVADGRRVWLCEGEKGADAVAALGAVGTTHQDGASGWQPADAEWLRGGHVVCCVDNDDAGEGFACKVVETAGPLAASLVCVRFPDLPQKADVYDFCRAAWKRHEDAGRVAADALAAVMADLDALADAAPVWTPVPASRYAAAAAAAQERRTVKATDWPAPPYPAAFSGLAGDVVRAIEPHSEADPLALLVSFLVAFGNLIGNDGTDPDGRRYGPYYVIEGTPHYTNLYAALVGHTATGRKGTSWGQIKAMLKGVADEWAAGRIVSGLSSGEGLISAVRSGRAAEDGGEDRRLLAMQSELASVLRVLEREGSTLSAVLRDAWDTGDLGTLTKKDPLRARGAHISVLGHITPEELRRYLTATETANGFANRFLFVSVKRSKLLPDGGSMSDAERNPLVKRIYDAFNAVRRIGAMNRDQDARALWHEAYPLLTADATGMYGALSARGAPIAVRLSMLYALLDHSDTIRAPHMAAALALWDYCARSVAFIFGEQTGDPVADQVHAALVDAGADGMTRTGISAALGRNVPAGRIAAALANLEAAGKTERFTRTDTGGRPAEGFRALLLTNETNLTNKGQAKCPICRIYSSSSFRSCGQDPEKHPDACPLTNDPTADTDQETATWSL